MLKSVRGIPKSIKSERRNVKANENQSKDFSKLKERKDFMKKLKKTFATAFFLLVLAIVSTVTVSAVDVDVSVNGKSFCSGETKLTDSITTVPFRAFIDEMTGGDAEISWDDNTKTAYAEYGGVTVSATLGESYITANGRCLPCGTANMIVNGKMFVAVRPLSAVFNASVEWIAESKSVRVGAPNGLIESADDFYDADDLYWLSRIISAEARGEPLEGKIAVGTVVYNRIESELYPDTVYDVIFDMDHGVQFTPAATGSVYNAPTKESVTAAKLCMEGKRYRSDALFFCTVAIKDTSWAGRNRRYIETIGNHAFFA